MKEPITVEVKSKITWRYYAGMWFAKIASLLLRKSMWVKCGNQKTWIGVEFEVKELA